jgi:hypothetical protein
MAIGVAEDAGFEARLRTGRSLLWRHLRDFRPVLHLLGAWEIRGRRSLSDKVAQAIGYDVGVDAQMLVQEGEALRQQIQKWEAERPQRGNGMTSDDSYQMTPAWTPEPKLGWPRAGGIPGLRFGAGVLVQTRGKRGRRTKTLSTRS